MISIAKTTLPLILLSIVLHTHGCSCQHVGILKNKKTASYVFKGRVIEISELTIQDSITATKEVIPYRETRYTFQITRNYKGLTRNKTIDIVQGITDCEVHFDMGKTYIVYAYIDDKKLHYRLTDQKTERYATTHLCMRTKKQTALTFWETFILRLS